MMESELSLYNPALYFGINKLEACLFIFSLLSLVLISFDVANHIGKAWLLGFGSLVFHGLKLFVENVQPQMSPSVKNKSQSNIITMM